jgi:hypothetical protein
MSTIVGDDAPVYQSYMSIYTHEAEFCSLLITMLSPELCSGRPRVRFAAISKIGITTFPNISRHPNFVRSVWAQWECLDGGNCGV